MYIHEFKKGGKNIVSFVATFNTCIYIINEATINI